MYIGLVQYLEAAIYFSLFLKINFILSALQNDVFRPPCHFRIELRKELNL